MVTVQDIVGRFGGEEAAAKRFDVTVHAVRKWPQRGLPWKVQTAALAEDLATPAELQAMSNVSSEAV